MRASLMVVFCVSVAMAAGCSSSDGGSGADGGGGGGVSCDPFAQQGQPVASTSDSAAPPAFTGGSLVEGTYVMTGHAYYNGDPGSSNVAQTIVFGGGTVKSIVSDGGTDTIYGGTYSTSGTTLTLDLSCPASVSASSSYTASATQLSFTAPDNANEVMTYTLQ